MEIKAVEYEAVFNLGDYENEKIRVRATLSEGDTVDQVVDELRQKCQEMAQPNAQLGWQARMKTQRELADLTRKLEEARQNWETVSTFLTAQGIKTDVASFPELSKLLPAAPTETELVATYNEDDEDDEDDEDEL